MRRLFALGLAVWLVAASIMALQTQPAHAQSEPILGDAPALQDGAVVAAAGDDIVVAAAVPAVDTSSRAASASFYYAYYTGQPAIGWTGSQASCIAGTTTAAFKQAVIDRVAFYRAMAGVPSGVGLAASASTSGQQAALMFSRNNQLSHSPASNWACYTSSGAQAAASSNIALGAHGVQAIDAYIKDAGGSNTAAGHRRWILFPQTQSFGTGDVPAVGSYAAANALSAWDTNVNAPRPATRDGFVAWPPVGYVPYQVVYPRWSLSYPNANFGSASVSVTLNGASIPVSIDSTTANGYGENTIVFRPNGLGDSSSWPNPGTDKTYKVKISGVSVGGQSRTFTYDVIIFDPSTSAPATTPTSTPSRTATGGPVTTTATPTTIPGGYAPGDLFKTKANLNMRSGPSTSAPSVAVLPSGSIGEVTGYPVPANGYTWYPVTVGGYGSGWAAGEYFLPMAATPTPTATAVPSATPTPSRTPTAGPPTSTPSRTPTQKAQSPTPTRIPGGFLPGDTVRTTVTVNFRSGPGTSYSVISAIPSNTLATVTGSPTAANGYTWYPLSISGVGSGWMASSYLDLVAVGNPEPSKTPIPTNTPSPVGGMGVGSTVYTTANLNIRSGPGTGYSSRGVAAKGSSATVTGSAVQSGSVYWFPLDVPGIGAGWASGSYLSLSPTVQGPLMPTTGDPDDELPEEETSTPAPTETPTVVDPVDETPEPTATGEEMQSSAPENATSTGEEVAVAAEPAEAIDDEPAAETTPEWLPVERVQRSPDSQPGQVLVDDDPGTVWFANGASQPLAMFVLDLGQQTVVSQVRWLAGDAGLSGALYLSISSDGEIWTDLDPILAVAGDDGWSILDAPATTRYVRFVFVNDTGADWLGGIGEVRIMP